MRWGATALPGAATEQTVAALPHIRYMRDFGKDGPDSDSLPELPPHGTGKWLTKPDGCLLHVSWKDDVDELATWLDGLHEDIWLTVWHEPHGDVTPEQYRATAARAVEIIGSHPNGHFVQRIGPVVTRYWLVSKDGDPLDWWVPGFNLYGIDFYLDTTQFYRTAEDMFAAALNRVRTALPGVEICIPEYGLKLIGDDTGEQRAHWMRVHADYLRAQPDIVAVGWWDIGGNRITGKEPEQSVWRAVLEEGVPMRITWLADELRAAGLTVVEHSGWKTRQAGSTWEPRFGIVHATAAPRSQSDDTQVRIVRDGREGLPGPIANACVDRAGRWHVLAAGRCNTTLQGTAGPYAGLGNTYALGVEACNDNRDEPWPDVQYRSYVRGWAAIANRLGWEPSRLRGHKEHTPGHKTDPTFSMSRFRGDVAAADIEEEIVDAAAIEQIATATKQKILADGGMQFLIARSHAAVTGSDPVVKTGEANALHAKLDALIAAVADVGDQVVARLGDTSLSPEQIANVLRPVLGDRAAAVGQALLGS